MALIGAILVEIKIIKILCKRLLREGDRQALQPCLSMFRPHGTPNKSGPIALNQFRPSVPVWSETLWQIFIKHVAISAWLILRIFTSYFYNKFRQLKKFINYTIGSSELNGLYKKSPCLFIPNINFKIAVTWFAKVNNQQYLY